MRLNFVGSSRFGLRCLKKIVHQPEIEVVGIITNPETFSISYRPEGVRNVLHADFRPFAEQHGIPIWVMNGKMSDPKLLAQVRAWQPNLTLVVGWYHMVPRAVREIAPAAGLHASLLPDYSGGAPLVWAIINDEKKTGISFFIMDDGVDNGPLIGQAEVPICFEDTIATLYARVEEAGLQLLEEHLPKIASGEAIYTPQDESKRRLVPQRSAEDGEIDWTWPARRVYNFIRAQTIPYPGAFTFCLGEKLIVWKAQIVEKPKDGVPGEVLGIHQSRDQAGFIVALGDGALLVSEVGVPAEGDHTGLRYAQVHEFDTGRAVLGR